MAPDGTATEPSLKRPQAPKPIGTPPKAVQSPERRGPNPQIVEVLFKGKRREYYSSYLKPEIGEREYIVVEADRGQDLGIVTAVDELARRKCDACNGCEESGQPSARVLRRAAPVDVQRLLDLREEEEKVRRNVRDMVDDHGLKMKVSDTEWQWDRNKLIIYFTADKRVDFRSLVRSLAKTYRTRIELKQIGVRDEAKRLDGVGRCGRELCSSNWLPELKPVTLQLAKDQNLSLNPSQISGACGRLMCSLRYEHEFYVRARKRFPKEGKEVRTAAGRETVVAINIFTDQVTLRAPSGDVRTVALEDLKRESARARERS